MGADYTIFVCLYSLQKRKSWIFTLHDGLIDIELNLNSVTVYMFILFIRLQAKEESKCFDSGFRICHVTNGLEKKDANCPWNITKIYASIYFVKPFYKLFHIG